MLCASVSTAVRLSVSENVDEIFGVKLCTGLEVLHPLLVAEFALVVLAVAAPVPRLNAHKWGEAAACR